MEDDHKYCVVVCEADGSTSQQKTTLYEAQYTYNNITYKIVDTIEMHKRLQSDSDFIKDYLKQNSSTSQKAVQKITDSTSDEADEDYLKQNSSSKKTMQKVTESTSDEDYLKQNSSSKKTMQKITESTTDEADKNFTWTRQTTKLLLESYAKRKNDFRNPKLKKRTLWEEIKQDFAKNGHSVTVDMLDRKMRNMKHTLKTIKDNNKRCVTGRRRILWEWYEKMDNIFLEDIEREHKLRDNRIEFVKQEIDSINKLTKAIEENNRIQAETNKIFRSLIDKIQLRK